MVGQCRLIKNLTSLLQSNDVKSNNNFLFSNKAILNYNKKINFFLQKKNKNYFLKRKTSYFFSRCNNNNIKMTAVCYRRQICYHVQFFVLFVLLPTQRWRFKIVVLIQCYYPKINFQTKTKKIFFKRVLKQH